MTAASLIASAFVADMLILSAGYKFLGIRAYLEAAQEYTVLRRLSKRLAPLVAIAAPGAEAAAAVLLVIPRGMAVGAALACALAACFLALVAGDDRRVIAHCGCWGGRSTDITKSMYLVRNGILATGALVALVLIAASGPWDGGGVAVAGALALVLPVAVVVLELPEILRILALRPAAER